MEHLIERFLEGLNKQRQEAVITTAPGRDPIDEMKQMIANQQETIAKQQAMIERMERELASLRQETREQRKLRRTETRTKPYSTPGSSTQGNMMIPQLPPSNKKEVFHRYLEKAIKLCERRLLVVGEFHAPHPEWGYLQSTAKGRRLHEAINSLQLTNITDHNFPTRVGNSVQRDTTPDLALTLGIEGGNSGDRFKITEPVGSQEKCGETMEETET
ncbi:hypothetical protein HPB47_013740 [Ixodes persulcatus]|uniref:Uncharacterized protein n=1 Tax=Ixodes persulcatus TaxID=34615 RepID=A0AC60QXQ6_IXOPE|nr:hypothetical protein HPB47_013740 [Ixodes persulcatus]